jgi:hypothetical protein
MPGVESAAGDFSEGGYTPIGGKVESNGPPLPFQGRGPGGGWRALMLAESCSPPPDLLL